MRKNIQAFNRVKPRSEESSIQLFELQLYFVAWLGWILFEYYILGFYDNFNYILFFLLLFGIIDMNYTYLGLFCFLCLMPIFDMSLDFLNNIFSLKNPFTGSLMLNVVKVCTLVMDFYGIKVGFRSFQVFKAEKRGFDMRGEIGSGGNNQLADRLRGGLDNGTGKVGGAGDGLEGNTDEEAAPEVSVDGEIDLGDKIR